MNMFNNKGKHGITFLVVLALVLQIVGPMVADFAYAMDNRDQVEKKDMETINEEELKLEVDGSELSAEKEEEETQEETEKIDTDAYEKEESEDEKMIEEAEVEKIEEDNEELDNKDEEYVYSNNRIQESKEIENLITDFKLNIIGKDNKTIEVENGTELELNIDEMNAVNLFYKLQKPNTVVVKPRDTYTIDLPKIFTDEKGKTVDIKVGDKVVATYEIIDNQIIITFTDEVEKFDDFEMNVNISGEFNTEIFETEQEVEVEVPYEDGTSYKVTIKAEEQVYEGEDKKEAGFQYVLNDNDEKIKVDRNPEYIDWTVRVNDNMGSFDKATIIDDLGDNLEIVEGSFEVERIIRNYKNEETGRETVTDFEVNHTTVDRFELDLGNIEDAYDISYTTKIIRPKGGGTRTINNNAKIILDGDGNDVSDGFTGTWSGDLPVISKKGDLTDDPHTINWEVEYNFGKEDLGKVTLTDILSHGEVDLDSVIVFEVDPDIDGNITEKGEPLDNITPLKTDTGMTLPELDASGKAYYITFSSTVPVGVDGKVENNIEDDLEDPNSDSDEVDVNTIPTGGKVGEQLVDRKGKPYIEWTITMNSNEVDVPSITVRDIYNKSHLDFDVNETSLYELSKDGEAAENFTIDDYKHTDGREGFKLDITDAGPHEYKFVYRTYYTTLGMQEPKVANTAELVFLDGNGNDIGDPKPLPKVEIEGPKAGIEKTGKYVLNDSGNQEIQWEVKVNKSKILLNSGSTITEDFTSNNYTYIDNSLVVAPNDVEYSLVVDEDKKGFVITLDEATNATFTLTFRTTVDDVSNTAHDNKVTLEWEGGTETAKKTVGKRDPGSEKTGTVVINYDGSKTVNWTIDFNTNKNVLHDFKLVDTYTPKTVTVSDIKITSGGTDVTDKFKISDERTGGTFTVTRDKLEAEEYKLTYSTTLSAKEEKEDITNTAKITYTGGSEDPSETIKKPTLGVKKEADGKVKKTDNGDFINWKIIANTDTKKHLVNLVEPVLTDTIPSDQKLVEGSIKVERVNSGEDENIDITQQVDFVAEDNNFTIDLPDGPYQYIVTFRTQILEYPSVTPDNKDKKDRISEYENYTTLENKDYEPVSDDAWIDYFADGTNNNNAKTPMW